MSGEILNQTYRIERVLGRGAMGTVYEVSHLRLPGRRYAAKVLSGAGGLSEQTMARFRREAEVLGELRHPNIVSVLDFARTEAGEPYIIMELLQGEDLARRLARTGPVTELAWVARLLEQVTSALQAAHKSGIVHRDLKPHNLFLCHESAVQGVPGGDDGPGPVKVVDFGLSKVKGSLTVQTREDATLGTPCYMAPEQAEGRSAEVDARADIYALGAVLFQVLGGEPPFSGGSPLEVLYQVVHREAPSLLRSRPDLPPAVAAVVARALSKDPAQRFANVEELHWAFVRAISPGARVEADTPGLPEERTRPRFPLPAPPGEKTAATSPLELERSGKQSKARGRGTLRVWPWLAVVALAALAGGAVALLATAPDPVRRPAALHEEQGKTPARLDEGSPRPVSRPADSAAVRTTTQNGSLAADLIPDARAVSADQAPEPAEQTGARTRTGRSRPARTASRLLGHGILLVVARIGENPARAEILLDGIPSGEAPRRLPVPAGYHLVQVQALNMRSHTRRVYLRAGEESRVVLELR